jgi:hypothetical protein
VGNATAAFLILQVPQPGALVGPGSYPITLTAIDQFGQRYSYEITLNVAGGANVGTISAVYHGGATITLTWPNNAVLQSASNALGPWTIVQSALSPYAAPITNAQGYFRTVLP